MSGVKKLKGVFVIWCYLVANYICFKMVHIYYGELKILAVIYKGASVEKGASNRDVTVMYIPYSKMCAYNLKKK